MGYIVSSIYQIPGEFTFYIFAFYDPNFRTDTVKVIEEEFSTIAKQIGRDSAIVRIWDEKEMEAAAKKFRIGRTGTPAIVITNEHPTTWNITHKAIIISLNRVLTKNRVRTFLAYLSRIIRDNNFAKWSWDVRTNKIEEINSTALNSEAIITLLQKPPS